MIARNNLCECSVHVEAVALRPTMIVTLIMINKI